MKVHSLYVGLTPPNRPEVFHCPLIEIVPRDVKDPKIQDAFSELEKATHLIFTSKHAVRIYCSMGCSRNYSCISIGRGTSQTLAECGFEKIITSKVETAEGVVDLISQFDNTQNIYFWSHAAKARQVIPEALKKLQVPFVECVIYDTLVRKPKILPNLDEFWEIIFTSPSTVDAFIQIFGSLPKDKTLTAIGPVTLKFLSSIINE